MYMYVHTQEYVNPPVGKTLLLYIVYKALPGYVLNLLTFFDHRREGLRFGIDYGVDEIIPPVSGHLQS